jgi:ribonuclease J
VIADKITTALREGVTEQHALAQIVRRTLGRWVNAQHRRRPMIVPVVIEG